MSELATAVFAAQSGAHLLDAPRTARFAAFLRGFDEASYRDDLVRRGLRWIPRGDPAFPSRLRSIHDPPPGLFVRGDLSPTLLEQPSVAVVGARACSVYGSSVAATLGARAGGCRRRGGVRPRAGNRCGSPPRCAGDWTTVAALGCGIDRDYPRAHAGLAVQIAAVGLVVSEYAPGVEPAPWRFPARNRLVAGLARATVVVEARERSGALITADLALDEGREVLAVPGEITSALSRGTNALLRLGATPVTCAADVLEALGIERPPPPDTPVLSGAAGRVQAVIADAPVAADELIRRTGLAAGELAAVLAELELLGLVTQADGYFVSLSIS